MASGDDLTTATTVSVVLSVLMCVPIALRRVRPALALLATTCAFAAFRWVDVDEFTGSGIMLFVSFASAGIHLVPPLRHNLRAGVLAVMVIVYITHSRHSTHPTTSNTSPASRSAQHRLLDFLRSNDDGHRDPITARPSLRRVGDLVDQAEDLGLDVNTEICGDTTALAPSIDVAAYRIVQEALTNTRKHAEASTADVTIRVEKRTLHIEVVDDGTATPDDTRTAVNVGHGLIGMRERAALHGGELSAGPLRDGGYRLCSDIPVMNS